MLVQCASCSAKFNVPDAKVAGKRARMKCKKCGAEIPIDGTTISASGGVTAPPSGPGAGASAPPRQPTPARRPQTSPGGISTRWRVSEPSGKSHEMSLGQLALRYSQGGFEPGTLVCRPGKDEWLPPYDFPEVMEKASPAGEALGRPVQQTFSEVTVTLGLEESLRLTREAQPSEPQVPPKVLPNTFFDQGDVEDAMSSFDNIVSEKPPGKPKQVAARPASVPPPSRSPAAAPAVAAAPARPVGGVARPASVPPPARPSAPAAPLHHAPIPPASAAAATTSTPPSSRRSVKPPAPSWLNPDASPASSRSVPPPPPTSSPMAPPLGGGGSPRPLSSRPPPPAHSRPPAPPQGFAASVPNSAAPVPNFAAPSANFAAPVPHSAAPSSGFAPPVPGFPPATPSFAQQAPAAPPAAPPQDFPDPTDFAADYPGSSPPSEPTFGTISQRPRKKKRSGFTFFVLLLILLAGAAGAVYLLRPALFEQGVRTLRGVVGLSNAPAVIPAKGPPFDEPAAGQVLGETALQAGTCRKDDGPLGKGRVQVLYEPSGKPTSVAVSKPFHETAVEKCLIALFLGTKVPAFGGEPVIVSKTFEVR